MSLSRRRRKLYAALPAQPASQAQPEQEVTAKQKFDYSKIYNSKITFILIALAIFVIAIYMRSGLLQYQGLFEPDGFFYYSWIKAIIANNLHEPAHIILGAPGTKGLGESQLLVYIPAIPYTLLSWTGITALQVMRWVPIVAALIEMILAYLTITKLSKSRLLGLLAMFFIAVSSGNIARTAALVFRGDSFISIPLMLSLYLLILGLESKNQYTLIILALATALVVSAGITIWLGGSVLIVIVIVALGMLALYSFVAGNVQLSKKTLIFTLAFVIVGPLQEIYIAFNAARPYVELVGKGFILFYLPLLALSAITYILLKYKNDNLFSTKAKRLMMAGVILILFVSIAVIAFPGEIAGLTQGLAITQAPTNSSQLSTSVNYAVSSTTQELQKPTMSFLSASFGLQLILAPIGIILFILFGSLDINKEEKWKSIPAFIILLMYLVIMVYLQYNAIRYNALLSIPLALFSAYALYGFIKLLSKVKPANKLQKTASIGLIIIVSSYILYCAYGAINIGLSSNQAIFEVMGVISLITVILLLLDTTRTALKNKIQMQRLAIAAAGIILLFAVTYCSIASYSSAQADGINPQFLSAMSWMKNNTPSNSLVLALWPDGSVVEGWANRTSYIDSVGGENGSRIYPFAKFLIANNSDTSYLYNISKPNYLVVRSFWLSELSGLITEGVPPDPSVYNFVPLSPSKIGNFNDSAAYYTFSNGVLNITLISQKVNDTIQYSTSISHTGALDSIGQAKTLVFYNLSNGAYTITNPSTSSNTDYTFMILFVGNQLSQGMLITPQLYESNLFKFLFLCNSVECTYNSASQNATMQLVYQNSDSKIFKINYMR